MVFDEGTESADIATNENILLLDEYSNVKLLPFVIVYVMTLHLWKRTLRRWTARRKKCVSADLMHLFLIRFVTVRLTEIFICMQYLFLPQAQVNQTSPLFCKLWNTIYREIINIMTIMVKIIKKRLNLYTKNILMGLGQMSFRPLFIWSNLLCAN